MLGEAFPLGSELGRPALEPAVRGHPMVALLEAAVRFSVRCLCPRPLRRRRRLPGIVEVHSIILAVRPLEGVVDVRHLVRAGVERLEDLSVRQLVPHPSVLPNARRDVEAVDVRVQELVREDVAPPVTAAVLRVNVEHLVDRLPVGVDVVQVLVRPGHVRDLAGEDRVHPQPFHGGVRRPEGRVQGRARLRLRVWQATTAISDEQKSKKQNKK